MGKKSSDAPFHRFPQGADLSALRLNQVANLEGIVINVNRTGPITSDSFKNYELSNKAVLIQTGWSILWGSQEYFSSGPFLTEEACVMMAEARVSLVGIDCANIDDMNDPTRPAHTTLLAHDIPIVEHLCALETITSQRFRFFAVPPAIIGGTSFPVRAFAICEE